MILICQYMHLSYRCLMCLQAPQAEEVLKRFDLYKFQNVWNIQSKQISAEKDSMNSADETTLNVSKGSLKNT